MTSALPAHASQKKQDYDSRLRNDLYTLLSHLLIQPPGGDLLGQLGNLSWDAEIAFALPAPLDTLRMAAGYYPPETVEREFEKLFIGMGRGEVVPYASWYAEKLLMGTPLVRLRNDLAKMHIQRREKIREPEDHAAALCETMALIIKNPKISTKHQAAFFKRHIDSWMSRFFRDLQQAPSARLYYAVGSLGEYFMMLEKRHLQAK